MNILHEFIQFCILIISHLPKYKKAMGWAAQSQIAQNRHPYLNSINKIFNFFWNNIYDHQKRFQLELKITLIFIKKWFYAEFKES